MTGAGGKPRRSVLGFAKGTTFSLGGLVAAIVVALGIPLVWVWIASQIAGTNRDLTPSLAILITTGIVVSYWLALLVGSVLRRHWIGEEGEQERRKRMSWNRSFRDEPLSATNRGSDPIERVFIVVALLAIVAFEIWFFFFAGSPLPNQPLF